MRAAENLGRFNEMIAADRRYIAAASVAVLLDDDTVLPSLPAAPRT